MKLIFIHGSGGVGDVWLRQKLHFIDADTPDLPGHPHGSMCSSVEEYTDWLHSYIRERKYSGVVLAGHSLGGGIVLMYALKYPAELRGVIPIGSGARLRVLPLIIEAIKDKLNDAQGWLDDLVMPLYATVDEEMRQMIKPRFEAVGPAVQLNDFLCCDKFDIMDQVGQINLPALAIVGDQDNMTPPKYSQYLVKTMPKCRMSVIEGAGHLSFMEKPDAVNEAIAGFLKEL